MEIINFMHTLNIELHEAATISATIINKLKQHDYRLAGIYIADGIGIGFRYIIVLLNTVIRKI